MGSYHIVTDLPVREWGSFHNLAPNRINIPAFRNKKFLNAAARAVDEPVKVLDLDWLREKRDG
jgi:hypothetical protein